MASNSKQKTHTLEEVTKLYLDDYNGMVGDSQNELEVRFGTRGIHRISKIDFDNVIKKLKSLNFMCSNEMGIDSLKIQSEFIDIKSGRTKMSNVRVEIGGGDIKKYCNSDSLTEMVKDRSGNLKFMIKSLAKHDGQPVFPINVDDFNFRFSYSSETTLESKSGLVKGLIRDWGNNKKTFRLMKRLSFRHPSMPLRVDMSIVKSSTTNRQRRAVPSYKFKDSGVVENPEIYEIEVEVENNLILGGPYDKSRGGTPTKLIKAIKKIIKYILAGLQSTNYPISYTEMDEIKNTYYNLINDTKGDRKASIRDFCGPSSYTLELKNIQPLDEDSTIPNIRKNFTVTDKADGLRKLLYIDNKGKIYFITTNMNIEFTGAFISDKKLYNSLLDGEHILHNKKGEYINTYAAFDIYFIENNSVRDKGFVPLLEEDIKLNFRLPLLVQYINKVNDSVKSITSGDVSLTIRYKRFYMGGDNGSIFGGCKEILNKIKDGLIDYETDGLIFTPMENAVGSNNAVKASNPVKTTWDYSFKWKPPEFNTIDFLISLKKQENGEDFIGNIFQNGQDMMLTEQITQYKIITLRCGFDQRKHGFINPCNDVITDNLPKFDDMDNTETYKPVPFYPTDPYDDNAHICNLILRSDQAGVKQMMTEDNEVFFDNTIVEFRYDMTRKPGYRWIPIKVRYDKTAEFRKGMRNYGNAYHVANSNWHSIHYPVTGKMLETDEDIPEANSDDIYYNRTGADIHTKSLRDFHNLVVKKSLINNVATRGDTLIDIAVGKGGDFTKWISAKLSFVFGIDISRDNIENKVDGACARFLGLRKQYRVMPYALFVQGNTALNIRGGEAMFTDKGKQITNAVFGVGPNDNKIIGNGVARQYAKGKDGFNVTSCQFALHYFFENRRSLEGFMRNIAECTKLGGYFIGGCYNGNRLFDMLKDEKRGGSMLIKDKQDNMLCQIEKDYDETDFPDNISSLGYRIRVYQDSINSYINEYLVSFPYLIRIMENYGFVPITKVEAKELDLPNGIGSFRDLFTYAESKSNRDHHFKKQIGKALQMSTAEKKISFLNNYFIFKKVRNVDSKQLSLDMADESNFQVDLDTIDTQKAQTALVIKPKKKSRVKKLKKKVKLVIGDNNN